VDDKLFQNSVEWSESRDPYLKIYR